MLVVLLAAAAGCSSGTAAPASTPTPTPTRADPVTACTNQLVYWAGEQLRGVDDGGDYQHHGLTSEQNDALTGVVADARARGLGPDRVGSLARAACERLATMPQPTGF